MAFSASQLQIGIKFDLSLSPKKFFVKDSTNYTGVTYSALAGLFQVLRPDGSQLYNNTDFNNPNITTPNVFEECDNLSTPIALGVYTFIYTVKLSDELQSISIASNNSVAKTITLNGNYVSDILNGTAGNFECVDLATTSLTVLGAVYSGGVTVVTIAETLPTLTAGALFNFTIDKTYAKTFQQEYSYVSPSVCLNWVDDQCCSSMKITDVTAYPAGSTVTRSHTISYPKGIVPAPADIEQSTQVVSISPIWTGTWVDVFTAQIDTFNGFITIVDSISGTKEHKVSADQGLCQIYACLGAMATKYATLLVTAPKRAAEMEQYINQASVAYMAYTTGKQCGEADYEKYLDIISTVATSCDCGCDCADCADGTPVQVVGCCEITGTSTYTIVIQPADGSLIITSEINTTTNTTTFTMQVSLAWFTANFEQQFGNKLIGELSDVDTTNIAGGVNQVLYWNDGTGLWERRVLELTQLGDVDLTGLADDYVLYYDLATDTFKFKQVSLTVSIATCTDVTLTSPSIGDILIYNGTKWVNEQNTYENLTNVDMTGIIVGDSVKWDGANWVKYTPVEYLDDLLDVVAPTPANNDRFRYVTGTGWINEAIPSFSGGYLPSVGFGYSGLGYANFSATYDPITGKIELTGVITSSTTVLLTTPIVQIVPSVTTNKVFPIAMINSGAQYLHGIAEIFTTGQIMIVSHVDATGATVAGAPAGTYFFDNISFVA